MERKKVKGKRKKQGARDEFRRSERQGEREEEAEERRRVGRQNCLRNPGLSRGCQ